MDLHNVVAFPPVSLRPMGHPATALDPIDRLAYAAWSISQDLTAFLTQAYRETDSLRVASLLELVTQIERDVQVIVTSVGNRELELQRLQGA